MKENIDKTREMMEFSGQKERKLAREQMDWIKAALQRAGTTEISENIEKQQVVFPLQVSEGLTVEYTVKVLLGSGKIEVMLKTPLPGKSCAEHVLAWVLQQRNAQLKSQLQNMFYEKNDDALYLKARIWNRDRQCMSLISEILKMNQVLSEDWESMEALSRGAVPPEIAHKIRSEYLLYEKEIEKNVSI